MSRDGRVVRCGTRLEARSGEGLKVNCAAVRQTDRMQSLYLNIRGSSSRLM